MAADGNASSYMNGIVCWLDAQDESTMEIFNGFVGCWNSKVPPPSPNLLNETTISYRKTSNSAFAGGILTSNEFGKPLISFDYDHWLECSGRTSWHTCRTMVSVHTWIPREGSDKCNFYIFSGKEQGPFHCASGDGIYSGHGTWVGAGGTHFHNGTIRVNGCEPRAVKELSTWRDGIKIATVQTQHGQIVPDFTGPGFKKRMLRVNRIGRDRVYHEFRGQLGEVMVWDRVLTQEEIEEVELVLFKKWFDWSMTLLPAFFEDTTQNIILDYAYGIGKFFLEEKRKMNEEQFRQE